jgi:hypothetical protein
MDRTEKRAKLEALLSEAAALAWELDYDQTAQRLELEPEFLDEQEV